MRLHLVNLCANLFILCYRLQLVYSLVYTQFQLLIKVQEKNFIHRNNRVIVPSFDLQRNIKRLFCKSLAIAPGF